MNTRKKIKSNIIILFLIVDVIHYFFIRMIPQYSNITESFYESNVTTFVKWVLSLLAIIGLHFYKKQKLAAYLLFLISIGMIWLCIVHGPLNHLLLLYSEVSLWIIGVFGVYILFLSGKEMATKNK